MWQSSLSFTKIAPMETGLRWLRPVSAANELGQYVQTYEDAGTVFGAMLANFTIWPSRAAYGEWETIEAPLVVIRGTVRGPIDVEYPEVRPGHVLVDKNGRAWEVILRKEMNEVALLVLTVRAIEGVSVAAGTP